MADKKPVLNVDADLFNADWTKTTWDNLPEPGTPEFQQMLKDQGMTQAQFEKLPVWQRRQAKQAS